MIGITTILIGFLCGIIYILIAFFKLQVTPKLDEFISVFLSGFAIGGSLNIIYLIVVNLNNPIQMGVFSENLIYIFLGSCSVIWISISQINLIYYNRINA